MGLFSYLFRKEKPDPAEGRRERLLNHGRITDGVITDNEISPDGGEVVFYVYTLNGVDFESSELLTPEQRRDPLKYAPGAKVAIRYDSHNQGNSTLA